MSTVLNRRDGPWLHLTLNRPERRNAMSVAMVEELQAAIGGLALDVRAVIVRGAGGHFCAGGDIGDMVAASSEEDPHAAVVRLNRAFGTMLQAVDACPVPVIAVCEGAVMGGGFGLAAVADVTIAVEGARFRLPETSLGITPAQIAAFLVLRLGQSQARRLAVTGETLDASEAVRLGLAHIASQDADQTLSKQLERIRRCEPGAVAATKTLMRRVGSVPLDQLLNEAAQDFAHRARSPTAKAGMSAFLQKQAAPWAQE